MSSLLSVGWAIEFIFQNNHKALRDFILSGGDFVSCDPRTGWSPLHFAGRYGRVECMKVLLDFGTLLLSLFYCKLRYIGS